MCDDGRLINWSSVVCSSDVQGGGVSMGMMQYFKTWAMRLNVIDRAFGVVIGTAFGKIVSSLVGDVIMPLLGFVTGGIKFTKMAITLKAAEGETPAVLL